MALLSPNFVSPLKIHDRRERLRIQARSADERTINLHLRHQSPYVVGFDAATVEDPKRGSPFRREAGICQFADKAMRVGRNFGRRRAPCADRPNWLVSNQNTRELRAGQRSESAFE